LDYFLNRAKLSRDLIPRRVCWSLGYYLNFAQSLAHIFIWNTENTEEHREVSSLQETLYW
jgi:hypothetical protein